MLSCQKHLFSLPDGVHYLNCAYMSPLSIRVEEAGILGIRAKSNPSAISPTDFFETSDRVRDLFGRLIGAPASSIAIIPAASYGIATAARNIALSSGQNIVVVDEQFPSNYYSWQRLTAERGGRMVVVKPPETPKERGKIWNERILETINAQTAVVSLPHVHWADGVRFDLEAIGRRARDVGAALIVDGTQSVGALPFDVDSIQPDALICAGYKWLMGPYSTGVAYYGQRFTEGTPLEENWITRKDSEHFGGLVKYNPAYQDGAIRYDVGERSNFALLPMLETALSQLHDWDVAQIQAYCGALNRPFLRQAADLGCLVEDSAWRADHLFGIRVRSGISMERLMNAIREREISVSVRGSAIRISPHVYNDTADFDALAGVLYETLKTF